MSEDTPTAPDPQSDPSESASAPATFDDNRVKLVAAAVAVGAGLLLGIAALGVLQSDDDQAGADQAQAQAEVYGGVALDPAVPRPDFTLTDLDGQPYDFRQETQGRLTVLFFGYTNCPDVCPIQMGTLAAALDQPNMPEPIVVFVTTDPERDTAERMREWLANFDFDEVVGLTGTHEEIAAAERATQVPGSARIPEEDGEDDDEYLVGHAAQMIAYTPDDLAHAAYPDGVRRENWIEGLPALMDDFRE